MITARNFLMPSVRKKTGKSIRLTMNIGQRRLYKLGQKDEAWHIYKKYLELVPELTQDILGMFAIDYFKQDKDYENSIKFYHLKGQDKPLSIVDNYWLGLAHYYLDEDLKADSVFTVITNESPDYAQGWMMRAKIGRAIEKADTTGVDTFRAKMPYEKYIELNPEVTEKNMKLLIEAYQYLGVYWVQHEDNDKGLEYFNKIVAIDPENETALEYIEILKQQ